MIRHPSEHFIKYLLTRPEGKDESWVIQMVVSLGYPRPQTEYIQWLKNDITLKLPANFQPQNRYHRDSVKFLRTEGIWSIYNANDSTRMASYIVTNLRVRPLIEQLLLGRLESREIAKKVNGRFKEFFTVGAIEAYGHYYWNVGLLRVEEWADLLEDSEYQRGQLMPILQVGPAMALHKTGFQQNIESKVIIREMMETLFFDFREWRTQPLSEERTRSFSSLAKSAAILDERLSQSETQIKDSLKAFEKFRMRHSSNPVRGIEELAPDGNFTQSGARLLEPAREDAEDKEEAK